MRSISRRQFGKTVAASAAAVAAGLSWPVELAGQTGLDSPAFPRGFVWGCATSAYQIEGAVHADRRGPSVWDVFAHRSGTTYQGQTGDVADDSYHLYKQDVRLLHNLGARGYRFSISWSRIFPQGAGQPNTLGIDYYQRLVDELLANGIEPYVTLFHWDLPQALPDGWQTRDTAQAFADYAAYVSRHLGDRVRHFMTTNEFICFTDEGYLTGRFAPGLKLPPAQVNQIRHHGLLAHGLGAQAIRAHAPSTVRVGLAENPKVFVPVIADAHHIEAARRATREENAPFLTTVLEGNYPASYLEKQGANAPHGTPDEMKAIATPLDFVGLNVYQPNYVRAADNPRGYELVPPPASFPHMASPWITVGPECIYWAVRNVCDLWHPAEVYITENGCSSDDVVTAAGQIEDTDRVMFLRNNLFHLQRAAEKYPVKGYFLWSLLDNFEWADGFSKRFGIHYVDFSTQKRIPKLSAEWYRKVIAQNQVV